MHTRVKHPFLVTKDVLTHLCTHVYSRDMSTCHYKPEQGAFDARLCFMRGTSVLANAADDSRAGKLKAIHKIACLAEDYRQVYTDAVKRVMEWERAR